MGSTRGSMWPRIDLCFRFPALCVCGVCVCVCVCVFACVDARMYGIWMNMCVYGHILHHKPLQPNHILKHIISNFYQGPQGRTSL